MKVDRIGRDCKLEISKILLMVDPRGGSHRVECGCTVTSHRVGCGCTVTSRRVGCGCTVWSFTTLGECGLSLSLGYVQ